MTVYFVEDILTAPPASLPSSALVVHQNLPYPDAHGHRSARIQGSDTSIGVSLNLIKFNTIYADNGGYVNGAAPFEELKIPVGEAGDYLIGYFLQVDTTGQEYVIELSFSDGQLLSDVAVSNTPNASLYGVAMTGPYTVDELTTLRMFVFRSGGSTQTPTKAMLSLLKVG